MIALTHDLMLHITYIATFGNLELDNPYCE